MLLLTRTGRGGLCFRNNVTSCIGNCFNVRRMSITVFSFRWIFNQV